MKGKTIVLEVKIKYLKIKQQVTAIWNLNQHLKNATPFMTFVEINLNMKMIKISANEKSACAQGLLMWSQRSIAVVSVGKF